MGGDPLMPKMSLKEIAHLIKAQLQGDEACEITGVASLGAAKLGQISFFFSLKVSKRIRGD